MTPSRLPFEQDQIDAANYWRGRDYKKFAVVVIAGPERRPTYRQTFYAGASTPEGAIRAVQNQAIGLPARGGYSARLAGPRELGCVPVDEHGRPL